MSSPEEQQNQPEKPAAELIPTTPKQWWNLIAVGLQLARDPAGRRGLFVLSAVLAILGALGLIDGTWFAIPEITPVESRFGWDEAKALVDAPIIAAKMPVFAITDEDGNIASGAGKNSELWKFVKTANNGLHIPTWKQESGDCVSMGGSNAIAYRMGVQIAREQRNELLKIPFPPYLYGISRVQIGKRQIRGAGSVGAWAAKGSQSYGVYPTDQAAIDGFNYSGRLADQWGQQGPPQHVIQFASKFRIRTVSQVKSWEDVRDALVHGYPVTVASNVGFNGGPYDRDGKRWLRPSGRWAHQMCFIGVEDRPAREKGAYCLNSWGEDAHPKPLNDEPRGGFWVDWQTVQRMVSQGDSWAYSDFDGFPADVLADWNKFKIDRIKAGDSETVAAVLAADVEPVTTVKDVRKMYVKPVSYILLSLAGMLFSFVLRVRANRTFRTAVTILLALGLITTAVTTEAGYKAQARRATQYQTYVAQCAGNCDPASCGCVNCQCPTQQVAQSPRAREVQTAGRLIAAADVPSSWNALSTLTDPPPVVSASWNALRDVPTSKASPPIQTWNALASVPPKQPEIKYRRICTGTGCYWVPE